MLPELLNEPDVDLENIDVRMRGGEQPVDELAIRQLMIEDVKLQAQIGDVEKTKRAIAATYDDRIAKLEARRLRARALLQAWLERQPDGRQKIRFEDVGTAYLAKGDPKVEVADRDALKDELGAMFTKPTFDETAAKNYALEQALAGNAIPAGVNVIPGGPGLRIKRA